MVVRASLGRAFPGRCGCRKAAPHPRPLSPRRGEGRQVFLVPTAAGEGKNIVRRERMPKGVARSRNYDSFFAYAASRERDRDFEAANLQDITAVVTPALFKRMLEHI